MKIGIIVGSFRKGSYSQAIASFIEEQSNGTMMFEQIDISNLPMFNQDYDDEDRTPEEWTVFRNSLRGYQGFIFITPEYNRGLPPVIKNALDVASRPYGKNQWDGKIAGVISTSMGALGGFGAHHQLRQTLVFLNTKTLAQPEMYLGNLGESVIQNNKLTCEKTQEFVKVFIKAYTVWADKNLK